MASFQPAPKALGWQSWYSLIFIFRENTMFKRLLKWLALSAVALILLVGVLLVNVIWFKPVTLNLFFRGGRFCNSASTARRR